MWALMICSGKVAVGPRVILSPLQASANHELADEVCAERMHDLKKAKRSDFSQDSSGKAGIRTRGLDTPAAGRLGRTIGVLAVHHPNFVVADPLIA